MKYFKHDYKGISIYVPLEHISDEQAMRNVDLYGNTLGINQIGISDGDSKTVSVTSDVVDGDSLQSLLVERKETES